jgi:signal transduction histidine kinase
LDKTAPRLTLYLSGILAALALTVILIVVVMQPPLSDLVYLSVLLGLTGLSSGLVGYVSYRLGWWRRLNSLKTTLTLGYVLAALLTLFNVWLTARLMFINDHDLVLASLLLLFAGGISVSFGYFLSSSITHALDKLARGAERLSEGDYAIRVPERGEDEVARVARAFNAMVARLEQVNEAERALEEARRNLVAWASHDLRTPLASLRAMIDAVADGVVTDPETIDRYLRQSQHELNRMNTLIDDLFELAQLDAGRLELFCENSSLADLISDTLEGFTVRAKAKGVDLTGWVSPEVDPVWMAPDKISRVLQNLVENAIRHTPPGGKIRMEADVENGAILVRVQDTGEGIRREDRPHIFDRFYRGEKSRSRDGFARGGAGLGLAIAEGLVEAHGGLIWVESPPDEGTTMCFTLPQLKEDPRAP